MNIYIWMWYNMIFLRYIVFVCAGCFVDPFKQIIKLSADWLYIARLTQIYYSYEYNVMSFRFEYIQGLH